MKCMVGRYTSAGLEPEEEDLTASENLEDLLLLTVRDFSPDLFQVYGRATDEQEDLLTDMTTF